jgi:hypothetical protein
MREYHRVQVTPLPYSFIDFEPVNPIIIMVTSFFCFARIENYVDVYDKHGKIKR